MKKKKILVGAASLALIPGLFAMPVLAENAPVNDIIKWDSECSVKLRHSSYGVQNASIPTVTNLSRNLSSNSYLSAANNFTGNDKAVYNVLHEKFKEVAEGKVTDTVFYISMDELKAAGWTVATTSTYDSQSLQNMQKANHEAFWKNLSSILTALLSDDTVNTAWYDKTVGVATADKSETKPRANAKNFTDYNENSGYMYFSMKPRDNKITLNGIWVKFAVIKDFKDANSSDPVHTVKKDGDGMTRAQKALAKAKEIVAEVASKSDVEKIKYYNEKISELTSYDFDYYNASLNGSTSPEDPYGGQSMFFNVFDGDEATKVVCEGYSKAFKLLCDLTTWQGKVECNIVTGDMNGGQGAGPHMWNIVTYNGDNYLVDTTNSDEGTIGAPDKLVLARVGGTYSDASVVGSVDSGYKISTGGSTISYNYDSDTFKAFTRAQLDIGTPVPQITATPLELTVKLGQTVDNKDLKDALAKGGKDRVSVTYNGSTVNGHFEWNSDVTSYGEVGTHTYKCKFVPDSNNYLTVENIDVNVTVKASVVYSLKYAWENPPASVTLPSSDVTFELGTDTTPSAETTFTKGQKVAGEKDGKEGNFIFSGWDEGKADENNKTFTYSGTWTFEANPVVPVKKEFTISYLPGEASGSMDSVRVVENTPLALPSPSFTAPAGKEFKAWDIDGVEYQPGYNYTFTKDTQVTAVWKDLPVVPTYKITKGMNSTWEKGSTSGLSFTCDGEYSKFLGLKLDGNTIDDSNYTSASGSTIVNLKHEYLESIPVGKHIISFIYNDGKTADVDFTIAKSSLDTKKDTNTNNSDKNETNSISNNPVIDTGKDLKIDGTSIKTPDTGERSNLAISVFTAIASGILAIGAIVFRKRKS